MVQSLVGKHTGGRSGSCLRYVVPPADFREKGADLRVRVELGHFVGQHFVGANAPLDKTPHSLFVGRAVRVGIERSGERPVFVFQQLDDEEAVLQPRPPEPQVLVKAQRALSVEMKTEELAGVQRMGDFVSRVEPSQGGVSQLRNDADTVWVF